MTLALIAPRRLKTIDKSVKKTAAVNMITSRVIVSA